METCDGNGCVVEMSDLPGKDQNPIRIDARTVSEGGGPSWKDQVVESSEWKMDSDTPSTNSFAHRNERTPDGMNHCKEAEKQIAEDQNEVMADSTTGGFSSAPPSPPPPFSSQLLHPSSRNVSPQSGFERLEFQAESRQRPTVRRSWRNSFYVRLSLEFIVCSTVLAFVIPVLGIPAVVCSIRSYRAYRRGGLEQSLHLNLLAFRLILVAGASLCCLAVASGFLTAYLLVRPIQIVSAEPPPMDVRSASSSQPEGNLFHVQRKELLEGRHNVSLLCQSHNSRCDASSYHSVSSDQATLPQDDPNWNPPEPLATLVRRAGMKVLKSPALPKTTSRGPS